MDIVVVDGGIAGWRDLAAEFAARGEVLVLDAGRDGVTQLAELLAERRDIGALHLVSHGEPGLIRLGTAALSLATLAAYRGSLDRIAAALAPDADVLLYGCRTGLGADGATFLEALAALTGARVAASRTLTGAAALGGDWELGAEVGVVRTAPLASRDFAGVLATGYTSGSDIAVNTYTSNSQEFPSVATLANGGFVVTWSSNNQDGGGYGIYGQIFNSSGAKVGSEFKVNTYTTSNQQDCSVAGLSGGGFVVTWSSYSQDGSLWGIYGQRYDSTGAATGSEFRVNTRTDHTQNCPAVTALSDGGFLVTWQSTNQDNALGGTGVYAQRYTSSGVASGSEFLVNTTTANDQGSSSVTALSGGGYVITWTASDGQDGNGYGVFAQIYDSANAKVGSEFQVNTYTTGDQVLDPGVGTPGPCIATLAGGGFVITWGSDGQDGNGTGVYAQVFTASGTKVGNEIAVNTSTTGNQQFPSITALADGGFVIAWGSDNGYHDYGQLFGADGTAVGSEFVIDTTDDADYPAVAALADGDFVATWMGGDSADSAGIYAKLFTNIAPTLSSSSPSDDGTAVAISSNLTLTFGETVAAGTGAITLYQSGGTAVETFNVATGNGDHSGTVSFSGSTVTIDPGSVLAYQTGYYLTVAATAVEDSAGKAYAGISDATTLNFTTTTAPASGGGGGGDSGTTTSSSTISISGGTTTSLTSGAVDATTAQSIVGSALAGTSLSAAEQAAANEALAGYLAAAGSVSVSTVTLSGSGSQPITITGSTSSNEAMIIDASRLPSGTVIILSNVEFAVIVGAVSVTGGAGQNYVIGDGSAQYIVLGPEDDTLAGGAGADTIGSAGGNDVLSGGIDNDYVFGGLDGDFVFGNQGRDLVFGNQGDDLVFGGIGDDSVFGGAGNDSVWGDDGNDNVAGDDGCDHAFGGDGADTLLGGVNADVVCGNQGQDVLLGEDGEDILFGGKDADSLNGGNGADYLSGDDGADTLTGGAGRDRFIYASPSDGGDVITDFQSGVDALVLWSPNFGDLAAGALDSRYFALAGAETSDTRFVFDATTGVLSYDADGSAGLAPTTIATLIHGRTITADDITLLAG